MVKRALTPTLILCVIPLLGQSQCGEPPCDGLDSDGDGTCDDADLCPGFDDGVDSDLDGAPDACDLCPDGIDGSIRVCADPSTATITTWPRDNAILQRDDNNQCALTVEGYVLEAGGTNIYFNYASSEGALNTLAAPLVYGEVGAGLGAPFSFTLPIPGGLVSYDYNVIAEGLSSEGIVAAGANIACGEQILVQGQSNAVAGDYWAEGTANVDQSPWIRSFGSATTATNQVGRFQEWGTADGEGFNSLYTIGSWPLHMAASILAEEGIPVGIINGAVGGTLISQHQRNDANPEDLSTIYGRMLYRSRRARVANTAKRMIWYQGESDGALGTLYNESWDALYQDWKRDFPALEDIYVFQVRNGCGLTHPFDATASLDFYNADLTQLVSANPISFEAGGLGDGAGWVETSLTRTVPAGAAWALHVVTPVAQGPVDFDIGTLTPTGGPQRLLNPNMEDGAGGFPDAWSTFGDGSAFWAASGGADGGRHVRLDASTAGILAFQAAAVSPGEELTLSIQSRATFPGAFIDIREVLRALPEAYDDITLMSTTGAPGHDGCHSFVAGYWELGDRMSRVIRADMAGTQRPDNALPPQPSAIVQDGPNTLRVEFETVSGLLTVEAGVEAFFRARGAVVMDVQPEGSHLRLTLDRNVNATTLSYLGHPGDGPDILNDLGIGMATFMNAPISQAAP